MLNLMILLFLIVLFNPILALHFMTFSRCQNYGGGGGAVDQVQS